MITCPAGAKIEITRSGSGAVYYSAKMTAYSPEKLDESAQNGLQIERIYSIRDAEGVWQPLSGPIPDGALVRVDLRVTTSKAYQYVLLEDPIPSGFEFRPEDDALAQEIAYEVDPTCDCRRTQVDPPVGWEPLPVTRRENRDDRAAFFLSLLPGKRRDPGRRRASFICATFCARNKQERALPCRRASKRCIAPTSTRARRKRAWRLRRRDPAP